MQRRRLAHPLPPDFFQCPVLTSSEADAMIASGVDALKHLVMHARLDDTSAYKWKLERATQDLQVYVGSDLTKSKGTVVFMSVTELHATLDEAASLLECDTSDSYRTFIQRYNKDVIDCAVLATLAPRTPTYPRNYIGLKWFVQETPLPCRNRDFCVVECCDDFTLGSTKGWARVLHSVDLSWVPPLSSVLGIVRGTFDASGTVFLETNRRGVLRAAQIFHVNLNGNLPQWILRLGIKKRARTLVDMDAHFRAQRMTRMLILPQPSEEAEMKCHGCHLKIATSRRSQFQCRRCNHIVCRQCCHPLDPPTTAADPFIVMTTMQPFACVCIPCVTLTASSNSPATSDNRPPQPLRNNQPEESFVDQHHNMRQGAAACNDANFVQSGVQGDFGAGQSLYWNSSQEDMQADWYEPIALQEDEAPERWRPMQYYHDDHADQHVLLAADNDDSAIHSDTDSNCFRL